MNHEAWEKLGEQPQPSWYLDPLVAAQKRRGHLRLIREWLGDEEPGRVLKTDLFEEAFGNDHILLDIFPRARLACGMDESSSTTRAAGRRFHFLRGKLVTTDARLASFRDNAFDLIVSTSTLDHFTSRDDFGIAVAELYRVLRPGGLLILTLDNPWNPLYFPLQLFSRTSRAPFFLGYTPSITTLRSDLGELGMRIEAERWLIHNPRLVSTLVFLALRKLPAAVADRLIRALLQLFDLLGKLPTRRFTACFQAVAARKPTN